ncbi:MAG: LysR family transcriptional regulator [Dermatophilaceae bacterium]
MDVRQLRAFLAVVDRGGVRRAAEHLHLAQPSVSHNLKTLERDLGVRLFHRTGRSLRLTSAGEALVGPARAVCVDLDVARATVESVWGRRDGGHLVVAVTPSQAVDPLPGVLAALAKARPGVQVSVLARATIDDVVTTLREGAAEIGLAAAPDRPYRSRDLQVHHLTTQGFAVVARPDVGLPEGPCRPDALPGAGLVVGQTGSGVRRAADEVLDASPGSHVVVSVEHREAVLPLVVAGLGMAIVAEALVPVAQAMGLATASLVTEHVLHIEVVRRRGALSPVAGILWELARSGIH